MQNYTTQPYFPQICLQVTNGNDAQVKIFQRNDIISLINSLRNIGSSNIREMMIMPYIYLKSISSTYFMFRTEQNVTLMSPRGQISFPWFTNSPGLFLSPISVNLFVLFFGAFTTNHPLLISVAVSI